MKYSLLFLFLPVLLGMVNLEKEKQVNTYTVSYQREPVIAMSKNTGKYIIVWTSNGQDGSGEGVYAQYFDKNDNKVGTEFLVNTTTTDDQNKPAVDMNSSGRCIIVWSSNKPDSTLQDIYGQIIDADGKKIGTEFLVNTITIKSQNCPDVGMDENGNFVVVWHSWDQDGGDRGVYAQRFKYDGTKIGGEFLVNTYTAYSQAEPSIDMASDGKFVVAWQSWKQENVSTEDYGVYAQIFNADGSKSGNEIHVNTLTADNQFYPDVAISDTGNFIITWTNWITYDPNDASAKPNYGEIFVQRFDSKGNKIGTEFQANTTTLEFQWLPCIALYNDNSFVISWGSWKQDGSREGVFLQFFNHDGSKNGKEHQVNYQTDNYQWEPQLVYSKNNEIIVAWSSWNQDGDDYGIYCRKLDVSQTGVNLPEVKKNREFNLKQNYPNPFNPETVIEYTQPKNSAVKINIFDSLGHLVITLIPPDQSMGTHKINWDGANNKKCKVPSGVYFYSVSVNETVYSKKMLLLK
jgi:hypothetical protein